MSSDSECQNKDRDVMKKNWRNLVYIAILSLLGLFAAERAAVAQALNWEVSGPGNSHQNLFMFGSFFFPSGSGGAVFSNDLAGVQVTPFFNTETGTTGSAATNIGNVGVGPIGSSVLSPDPACVGTRLIPNQPTCVGTLLQGTANKFNINSLWFGFQVLNGATPVSFVIEGDCGTSSVSCAGYEIFNATFDAATGLYVAVGSAIASMDNGKAECFNTDVNAPSSDFCESSAFAVPEIDAGTLPKGALLIGALLLLRRGKKEVA